ncbi:sporulation protein YabP [Blautia glucerasea]|uniref:sporulation protein YabP n=1 Tax=Blautia glucerasea TaxID=536633 RepID=UPI001D00D108|nr:sporulation protein YabP [Blautia glucerasea]MCB5386430.1 sporulation protein YabP [Blautia glucerasea]MCB5420785.1 sporulation protein YabP [Blautia luti]
MEEKIRNISHKLTLDNRKEVLLTGVKDVVSFDEKEILLQTSEGRLQIRGSQLHVKGLDLEKGEAVLAGHVDSLVYLSKDSPKKEEPLFTRLFR